jgi:hypothetical protein
MTTITEVADILNGTLQEDTPYRGQYVLNETIATFDISGLELTDFVTELIEGLNESEDGEEFTFAFANNDTKGEFISVTRK